MLAETAMGLIQKYIPPPNKDDYRRMIRSAGQALLEPGVTSATDPAVMPDLMEVYRSLHASGELPLRINTLADEWKWEFFQEGFRFWTLVRLGIMEKVMGYESFRRIYPIPFRELVIEGNLLEQNPGYGN